MAQPRKAKQINLSEVVCFVFCLCVIVSTSQGKDTLQVGEQLTNWDVLNSSSGNYQLNFFSLTFSSNIYLGIKESGAYAKRGTGTGYVWVANRDSPLVDSSVILYLTINGTLMINTTAGSSFIVIPGQQSLGNLSLTLLDTGNLVLRDRQEVIIWQSFDFPSDTWLTGMKIGLFDLKSGQPRKQFLTSWASPFAPFSGAFTMGVDPKNTTKLTIWRRGSVYWHMDWGSDFFTYSTVEVKFNYTSNENESYFTVSLTPTQIHSRVILNSSGEVDMINYLTPGHGSTYVSYSCAYDNGGWVSDWIRGCTTTLSPPNCPTGDEFLAESSFNGWYDGRNDSISLGINDCREICMKNCSCIAYSSLYLDGTGCLFGRTYDGVTYDDGCYTRQKGTDSGNTTSGNTTSGNRTSGNTDSGKKPRLLWVFIVVPVSSLILIVVIITFCYRMRRIFHIRETRKQDQDTRPSVELNAAFEELHGTDQTESRVKKDNELPFFSFSAIKRATDNFAIENKLGQGGFGPVYKGTMENGQEIAVKRLSQSSGQGVKEFKNEVILISKLQHRNLVRLLGCCMEREEKLLIYEYMPNKSLDSFIFGNSHFISGNNILHSIDSDIQDVKTQLCLDWGKRFCIIEGIAQGLLYLHKYSRLRIIHRDLKTSNILLDAELNPKISDFGLARTFRDNESRGNTTNIAGTRGYMSPEYAMGGLFSIKSDVFSFGVMVLEIISGKKNASFYHCDRFFNLLGYAWELWNQDKSVDLMDPRLAETLTAEVARCLHIGLLCVQENAADRPTMSDVVSMLNNETIVLSVPKQPAFSTVVGVNEECLGEAVSCSINDVTVSDLEAR